MKKVGFFIAFLMLLLSGCGRPAGQDGLAAARQVIETLIGPSHPLDLDLIQKDGACDRYEIQAEKGTLTIRGSSPTAICYAFDLYLRQACHSMVCWGGENLQIPEEWPDFEASATSPYPLRYFLNVCTFGYTAPYWDWDRWSAEIDWMALHGVNMPLASVASESIARRVWAKMGLSEEETNSFFTGPAHLPWHRMGNINGFDGPLDEEWHESQIVLQHRILEKMRALGMEPVAPAFAGFVPPAFMKKYPDAEVRQLEWGGFPPEYNACVLSPDSPYFVQIGKMFVEEWEKEFGKAKYYLSDSFNEMRLPVDPHDTAAKHEILKQYGRTIYRSIAAGNPEAVWVTQGWTFGYQHDFWDPESLAALLSEVPDDKMIIVDLGNDYPKWVWHTEQTWKVQQGFHGKQWIYSYVPNFGGKVLPTGDLQMYASGSVEALHSDYASNLVGFGSAPEGLENNEVVYELLADMGWRHEEINLDDWLADYCEARYGYCDDRMQAAWELMIRTVYRNLYSYPRFTWQTVVPDQRRKSQHNIDEDYFKAVELFLSCAGECAESPLFQNDAVEFTSFCLAELADREYETALEAWNRGDRKNSSLHLDKTIGLLTATDRLLASHPNRRLETWVAYARKASRNTATQALYEANAKRLVTTWGGWQEDYAARLWSGLIRDYYIPRIELFLSDKSASLDEWEEKWIHSEYQQPVHPYENPLEEACNLFDQNVRKAL